MAVGSHAPAALAPHPLDIHLAALMERAEKAAKRGQTTAIPSHPDRLRAARLFRSSAEFGPHMTLIEVLALRAGVFILSCWGVLVGAVGKCAVVPGYSEHYRCRIEVLHHERQRTHFVGFIAPTLIIVSNLAGIASSVHPAFVISDQAPSKNSRELR